MASILDFHREARKLPMSGIQRTLDQKVATGRDGAGVVLRVTPTDEAVSSVLHEKIIVRTMLLTGRDAARVRSAPGPCGRASSTSTIREDASRCSTTPARSSSSENWWLCSCPQCPERWGQPTQRENDFSGHASQHRHGGE